MGRLNLGSNVELVASGTELQLGNGIWDNAKNTFKSGSGGNATSPIVSAYAPNQSAEGMTDATWTKNTWLTTEVVDTDNAYSSSRFTVPADRGGLYYISTGANLYGNDNNIRNAWVAIYKNGSRVVGSYNIVMAGNQDLRHFQATQHALLSLAAGDYIEQYMYLDVDSGALYFSSDSNGIQGNHLIIYKL